MRLTPLDIIINKSFKTDKKIYLVSGNEPTLIHRVVDIIIKKYQENDRIGLSKIESIIDLKVEAGLFDDKKIYVIKSCKDLDEKTISNLRISSDVFIFFQENSQKLKKIKNIFTKDKDCYLIDCYELDRSTKSKILNNFLKSSNIKMEDGLYWELVEKLDNKYAFFENSLNKITQLEQKDINQVNIRKLLTINDAGKERVFFSLLKKNKEIVVVYREKIATSSDVNELFYYCKSFCQLIIDCKNENEYYKKIPVYLFREKDFLINLYKKYNSEKKKMLIKLLSTTENILRKESGLSLISGLRFILNIKKITIS